MSDEQLSLPGLGAVPDDRAVTELETAVRQSFAAHAAEGHLTPADAGKLGIALELCKVAGQKRAGGRLSTVSNDLRLLAEILDSLVPSADADANAALLTAMREWEEEIRREQAARDPGPEVRHPAGP